MMSTNRKIPLQLIFLSILALGGIGASFLLTQHFYDIRNGASGFKSFCNIGQTMNCDVIAASPYAELIAGIPLSSFAAGWFLALFLTSIIALNPDWRREAIRACFALTGWSVVMSTLYFFVMMVRLKTYCLLCLVTDGISLASFITVLTLRPEGFAKKGIDLSKWKAFIGLALASVAAMVFGLRGMDTLAIPSSDLMELVNSVMSTPALSVSTSAEYPSIGPSNAPITVVEFSDFQCPFCRIGAFGLNAVMNRYPDKIRVVFRNFPLDQSCNLNFKQSAHPFACEAAKIALCAHRKNKFEVLYQEFFERQARVALGQVMDLAKSVGLDEGQIQSCVSDPSISTAITKDIDEATLLGVKSTPTFFINGHKMEGAYPPVVWNKIIDQLLNK